MRACARLLQNFCLWANLSSVKIIISSIKYAGSLYKSTKYAHSHLISPFWSFLIWLVDLRCFHEAVGFCWSLSIIVWVCVTITFMFSACSFFCSSCGICWHSFSLILSSRDVVQMKIHEVLLDTVGSMRRPLIGPQSLHLYKWNK